MKIVSTNNNINLIKNLNLYDSRLYDSCFLVLRFKYHFFFQINCINLLACGMNLVCYFFVKIIRSSILWHAIVFLKLHTTLSQNKSEIICVFLANQMFILGNFHKKYSKLKVISTTDWHKTVKFC